ncbi:lysosomal alpha-glucosidase-like [Hylaeus anthracinus]|uniref:lysosomal alpha-glucosidase-like n=1 Tax=Hylaeus anthracinus TaxID=313031 RepID=UPI0023B88ECD|nr:lysosomal alpha-glucosidase-like [Hylaeus anthracinus]
MIDKGMNHLINKTNLGKSSLSKNDSGTEFLKANMSRKVDANEKKQHLTKNIPLNLYLKYILPCDFLRLTLIISLFCALLLFIRQAKYVVVEVCEININFDNDNESSQNSNYELIDPSNDIIINERYKYDVTFIDAVFQAPKTMQCNNVPEILRFDCHPENGISESSCMQRGCCWKPVSKQKLTSQQVPLKVPYCYYPKNWSIYKYENFSKDGNDFSGFLKQTGNSFYKNDLPLIKVETTSIDESIMRLKISDALKQRYEPPWPIRTNSKLFSQRNTNTKYKLDTDNAKPGFKVYRTDGDTVIFDSIDIGGFIFADQLLQISALLPSHNIYGIGEHQTNLKLNTNWQSFTFFNKDQPPIENANLYGTHPFYLIMEDSGKSHGVLFLNSNAMDVILQPSPGITFRTIGGIFDIYFFLGPTPTDVIKQYSEIVGKPFLPPYWSLGFHLCRYGYGTLEKTKQVWNRTIAAGIPFDTQWNDLDYMDKNDDFTYNTDKFKDLPQFVNEMHSRGMHYIPLIDAGISGFDSNGTYTPYVEGLKEDIFVKDGETNQPFMGKVWNLVSTVWPDFTNPKTKDYYFRMMKNMHDTFAFDGAWIDMNEPSNFYDGLKEGCPKNNLDYPEYVPNVVEGKLAKKTLCMNAKHYIGPHYNLHNTYGTSQAIATNYALTKIRQKRPFIISRSTWVGHGYYAGHWTGDIYSSWHDLKMSIPAILSMNFYQIPMVGADICGFNGNATAELCNRWMQLGAFYPFSRNHNSDDTTEQDPVAMGELVVQSSRRALTIRYWFLPYLYTLFFRAHKFGETVARPLFFEFLDDPATYDIDTQFLWGRSLMIVPVLKENEVNVTAYLPRGLWYDFYTKKAEFARGEYTTLDAPLDIIPLMIRGGSILPGQKPGPTTTDSRKNGFELLITLDKYKKAKGELYWDDGDSLDSIKKGQFLWMSFAVENNTLSNFRAKEGTYNERILLDVIYIWGVTSEVSTVVLNGRQISFEYNDQQSCMTMTNLQMDLRLKFILYWK